MTLYQTALFPALGPPARPPTSPAPAAPALAMAEVAPRILVPPSTTLSLLPAPADPWRVLGATVRGASHVRKGLPNEDALRWQRLPPQLGALDSVPAPIAAAVSDGHGSARCFRSHVGARLAVDVAMQTLADLRSGGTDVTDLAALQHTADRLVRGWTQAVNQDLCDRPLRWAELAALQEEAGVAARRAVMRNPVLAYGATLLAALLTDRFVLYLQLGDGDILVVSPAGAVTRPLPADPRLIANETTSLCSQDARQSFRIGLHVFDAYEPPALIMLSTDGYANSFRDERGFLQVGSDLLEALRTEGVTAVDASLETWLNEASALGSGDDVTVALLYRAAWP